MPHKALTAARAAFAGLLVLTAISSVALAASTYTVRPGDSLFAIAQRFHTSVGALEKANGIGANGLIRIGQILRLPTAGATGASALPRTYAVRPGDTLSAIAARLGVALPALEAANGLGPATILRIGERLTVPGASPTAAAPSAAAVVYRVRAGDTLSAIAGRFGVPLSQLYRLNGLGPNSILRIGEHLRIRSASTAVHAGAARRRSAPADATYRVRTGDTLSGIAAREGLSLATLMELNPGVNAADLQVGASLQLPGPRAASGARAAVTVVVPSSFGDRVAAQAQRYLGVPYVYGGATPAGFDCSGLVQYVFAQLGVSVPRDATDQYYAGQPVARADLQPGDLVFFDTEGGISHDGIYIGNGEFVNAPAPGQFVEVDNLYNPYWQATFIGARALGPMN